MAAYSCGSGLVGRGAAPGGEPRAGVRQASPPAEVRGREVESPPQPERPRRLEWSALLARVFEEEVLRCPCGGRRRVTAFLPERKQAKAVLEELGIDATAPPIAPARVRPEQEWLELPEALLPDWTA